MTMLQIRDAHGAQLPPVELLWPGAGLRFEGPHRLLPGGVLTAEGTLLVLPGLRAARECARGLLLAWRPAPGQVGLGLWTGRRLRPLGQVEASGVHLGGRWLTWWKGARAGVLELAELQPVQVPLGARRAVPWPDGPGLVWADGRAVLRFDGEPARSRVAAVLDGAVRSLEVGPQGVAIAWTASRAWSIPVGAAPVPLALEPPGGSVAWAPDGRRALVEDAHGTAMVDVVRGEVEDYREAVRPAGWEAWADVSGEVHAWEEESEGDTPLPGPGLVIGRELHGPGGLAWSLRRGEAVGLARTEGADLAVLLGDALVVVEEQAVFRRDEEDEEELLHLDRELPLRLWAQDGRAVLQTSEGAWAGTSRAGSWRRLESAVEPPTAAPAPALLGELGLPFDGWLQAPDGRTWAWQDDGVLVRSARRSG